nr:ABC transporter ATP-binding protein [uncultured Caproiciproducens sp.]
MGNVIEVNNVSMRFNLAQEKTDSIKEYFVKAAKHQLLFHEFYALRDISFQVKRGESLALVGANGSGKSTMLKLIAGVMYPSKGSLLVKGDIAPMIELGAGFDMELTARENIFLNGAVLGHDYKVMQGYFEKIMDFAELWDFVDVPVKNFSNGMVARLGFAIATAVKADILIVDEILAVGDFMFQEKCQKRMKLLLANGTTLLLVSHNEKQVEQLCKRAIWINHGKMQMDGECRTVCDAYHTALKAEHQE